MGRTYTVSKVYPVSAETLWADILDPNSLAESMKGALSYSGLPSEPVFQGQRIVVSIKRWGWFPMGQWTMDVVRRDDERHILESSEFGSLVRNYRHRLEIETLSENEARYTDYLDLDAGLFTDLVFPTFVSMYENRHQQRLKRLLARNSS
jgi:hypothetical protein